jgi:hypothetical protein
VSVSRAATIDDPLSVQLGAAAKSPKGLVVQIVLARQNRIHA